MSILSPRPDEKKAIYRWMNHRLSSRSIEVKGFHSLKDGLVLYYLYEVLSGERVHGVEVKPKSYMFSKNLKLMLQKIFSHSKDLGGQNIMIRDWETTSRNEGYTISAIWILVLSFVIPGLNSEKDGWKFYRRKTELSKWVQDITSDLGLSQKMGKNWTKDWMNGILLCGIIASFRPDLINNLEELDPSDNEGNVELAFSIAEKEMGVPRILEVEDVAKKRPKEKMMVMYVSLLHSCFPEEKKIFIPLSTRSSPKRQTIKTTKTKYRRRKKKIFMGSSNTGSTSTKRRIQKPSTTISGNISFEGKYIMENTPDITSKPKPKQMDIQLVYDITGSMGSHVQGVSKVQSMKKLFSSLFERLFTLMENEEVLIPTICPTELGSVNKTYDPVPFNRESIQEFINRIPLEGHLSGGYIPSMVSAYFQNLVDQKKETFCTFIFTDMEDGDGGNSKILEKLLDLKKRQKDELGSPRFPGIIMIKIGDAISDFDVWCRENLNYCRISLKEVENEKGEKTSMMEALMMAVDVLAQLICSNQSHEVHYKQKRLEEQMRIISKKMTNEDMPMREIKKDLKKLEVQLKEKESKVLEVINTHIRPDETEKAAQYAKKAVEYVTEMEDSIDDIKKHLKKIEEAGMDEKIDFEFPEKFESDLDRHLERIRRDYMEMKRLNEEKMRTRSCVRSKLVSIIKKISTGFFKYQEKKFAEMTKNCKKFKASSARFINRLRKRMKENNETAEKLKKTLEDYERIYKKMEEFVKICDEISGGKQRKVFRRRKRRFQKKK